MKKMFGQSDPHDGYGDDDNGENDEATEDMWSDKELAVFANIPRHKNVVLFYGAGQDSLGPWLIHCHCPKQVFAGGAAVWKIRVSGRPRPP